MGKIFELKKISYECHENILKSECIYASLGQLLPLSPSDQIRKKRKKEKKNVYVTAAKYYLS